MRLLTALVVWIGAVAGAVALSTVVAHSIHNKPPAAATSAGSGGGSGAVSFDPSSVKPTDPKSLFRTSNFAQALRAARAHLGSEAELVTLALYPGYLVMTAVRAGSEINVYIAANGRYTQTDTGGNPGSSGAFSLTRVQTGAPEALAQRIATAGHVPESELNYMVAHVSSADNRFRWLVYPRRGTGVEYFQASGATGRLLEYRSNSSTGLQPVR